MTRHGPNVIRFSPRRAHCIRLVRDPVGGWLIIALERGWLHNDHRAALDDARWLAQNLRLPIRTVRPGRLMALIFGASLIAPMASRAGAASLSWKNYARCARRQRHAFFRRHNRRQ
jgi:hypothetical protein